MRRIPWLGALVLLGALTLSACDVSLSADAARVNGQQIGQKTLNDTMTGITKTSGFFCVITGGQSAAFHGAGGHNTYSSSIAAALLTTFVDSKVFLNAAKQMGLPLTPLAKQLAVQESSNELAPASGSSCTAPGATVLQSIPLPFRNALLDLTAARSAIGAHLAKVALTPAGMASYAASHQSAARLDCISAIVVATKASALALAHTAKAGASFSALARAHSTDAASAAQGGVLGCVPPSDLTSPLSGVVAALAPGQISAPIAINSSYVILLLSARRPATDLEIGSLMESAVNTKVNNLLDAVLAKAKVQVDPNYGSWKNAGGSWQVVPPSGPASKWVNNLPAVTPTPASN